MDNPMKYKLENGTLTITGCDPEPTGDLIIPDTIDGFAVTSIGDCAFAWCNSLTSVTLPSSITSIGYWAFPKHTVVTKETI